MSLQTPVHLPDAGLEESDQLVDSDRALRPSRRRSLPSSKGTDRYGLVALLVAAGGLGAVLVLQSRSAVEAPAPEARQSVQLPVLSAAPPVRDQWYLDEPRPATTSAAVPGMPPARDRWYLDEPQPAMSSAASPAEPPARDRWYLEEGRSPSPSMSVPALRDQWYRDRDTPSP